jgi:hypothetical protein
MMELDYPTIVSSVLVIAGSVGGLAFMTFKGKVISALGEVIELLVDVTDLLQTIAEAGSDETLTPEEWAKISKKATEIKTDLSEMVVFLGPVLSR